MLQSLRVPGRGDNQHYMARMETSRIIRRTTDTTVWESSYTGTTEPSYGMSETVSVGSKGISEDTTTSYTKK